MFNCHEEPVRIEKPCPHEKQIGELELANRIQEVLDTDQSPEEKVTKIREILIKVFGNSMNQRIVARGVIKDPSLLEKIGNPDQKT